MSRTVGVDVTLMALSVIGVIAPGLASFSTARTLRPRPARWCMLGIATWIVANAGLVAHPHSSAWLPATAAGGLAVAAILVVVHPALLFVGGITPVALMAAAHYHTLHLAWFVTSCVAAGVGGGVALVVLTYHKANTLIRREARADPEQPVDTSMQDVFPAADVDGLRHRRRFM